MIRLRGMSQLVRYEVRDRVAVITVDNPPVNALSAGVPEGISDAVERALFAAVHDIVLPGFRRFGFELPRLQPIRAASCQPAAHGNVMIS